MNSWSEGYMTDIDYDFGYYKQLNPWRIRLAFLMAGLRFPEVHTACELGFGQGLSLNIHAAASDVEWYGNDFNPNQCVLAGELAAISGAHIYDDSFADFCERKDLPDFDFIGLHGVWSWVSEENRHHIIDFIKRKLKVGGVVYIGYNTQPGWTAMLPMRDLLANYRQNYCSPRLGIARSVDKTLEFAAKLRAVDPSFIKKNPHVVEILDSIKDRSRSYLAHEYFNRDWRPMSFADFAEYMSAAKCSYVCSANYQDNIDMLNLTGEQIDLLAELPDTILRESVRDFCRNATFRSDYWVKGSRQLDLPECAQALRQQRVILVSDAANVERTTEIGQFNVTLEDNVYDPILNIMGDHTVWSIGDLEKALSGKGIALDLLLECIMALISKDNVYAVQDNLPSAKAKALNDDLLRRACHSKNLPYLASPLTGGGIETNRIEQIFLLAHQSGVETSEELAKFAWNQLSTCGTPQITNEGKPLETEEEVIAEFTNKAGEFVKKKLPVLQRLHIA